MTPAAAAYTDTGGERMEETRPLARLAVLFLYNVALILLFQALG